MEQDSTTDEKSDIVDAREEQRSRARRQLESVKQDVQYLIKM